jgi:hypothetical protein
MNEHQACGRGLADQAVVPARFADVMEAVAATLETHTCALDPEDENAQVERRVYDRLADGHRRITAELRSLHEQMAGAYDLPPSRHDAEALVGHAAVAAYERYVDAEQALLDLLQSRIERDRRLLGAMAGS